MNIKFLVFILLLFNFSCSKEKQDGPNGILGFDILDDLSGHWVGTNETAFGFYDWFAFDFRPISASHVHSIYEGGTNENIITSIFLAEYEGQPQIMARNGGWLGNQYRATYFILDKEEKENDTASYRLVDAVGGIDRAYIEFKFFQDSIHIDAYKDNSGSLDKAIHHMGFKGSNRNPNFANTAKQQFNFPQEIPEVNLTNKFIQLVDPDSALFLEESLDPFPKTDHGYLSDLSIDINRNFESENRTLLLFISKEILVSSAGELNLNNLDNSVIRTIEIQANEARYLTTYLHPDEYYLTVFADFDNNGIPSTGDYSSHSKIKDVEPESLASEELLIEILIP